MTYYWHEFLDEFMTRAWKNRRLLLSKFYLIWEKVPTDYGAISRSATYSKKTSDRTPRVISTRNSDNWPTAIDAAP